MRYTTIIDLRDFRRAYSNINVRLLYLHLVLASGYHAEDRDLCQLSLRQLAQDTGITLSAVRNAVKVLTQIGLLARQGDTWKVSKFVMPKEIPPRARASKVTNGYSSEVFAAINKEFSYDEKKALEAVSKSEFMWVFETIWRLHESGDTTGDKYLRQNWNHYQAERLRREELLKSEIK